MRLGVLVLVGAALMIAGCNSTSVVASVEAGASSPTGPPDAGSRPPALSSAPSGSVPSSTRPGASRTIDSKGFSSAVDDPWFPLVPGTTFTYKGTKDDKKAVETFTVTGSTKVIDGVTCVVVENKVSLAGVPTERLVGYYAQDRDGNVWYFGEDMQELDASGHVVSTAGSWHAGIDKAKAAFFMEASPMIGHTFAHAYTSNDYAVVSLSEKVNVPYGAFTDALMTKEWSLLEPDVEAHKYYVRGLGMVRDVAVKGPTEELVLVSVDHG
jgi:hypothetical protein